jgi:uncharacterized protein YcaQ
VSSTLKLGLADARRFHRRAVLLDNPVATIGAALDYHGFTQIDPINVCGRMHDLILRNRVIGYREGGLIRHLHGDRSRPLPVAERTAFEHHLPHSNVLAALPLDAWPFPLAAMRRRSSGPGSWSGKLDRRQRLLADSILTQISTEGPLCSDDVDDDQRVHQGWGVHASLAKATLHKLFYHGRLLISHRVANRRYYDLPERVLPRGTLASSEPSTAETARWITLLKLRQRRLIALSRLESRHIADCAQSLSVEGCPTLYCLKEDLRLLDETLPPPEPRLLAPLDPLIYDRRLTHQLWGFDYTWEVYTPAVRRVRGYYALPVLVGLELVGHIDPKADRASKRLVVMNRSLRRGHRAATAVRELAQFLGLK